MTQSPSMQPSSEHLTTEILVLGAGSWGTALALLLARNGHQVTLWSPFAAEIQALNQDRENKHYLPGHAFPNNLQATVDLEQAMSQAKTLLVVVPSHAFRCTLEAMKPFIKANDHIVWGTKGLEPGTGNFLHVVAREVLGEGVELAMLAGPSFATEVAEGMPTAVNIASDDADFANQIAQLFHVHHFRVYPMTDMIGTQLAATVKNVMAIATGISDGLGFKANTRCALITRGIAEMMRLGITLGAQAETFLGLSGMGDLILTCTDDQSRNRRFGLALGRGEAIEDAKRTIGQVVEGALNAKEVRQLAMAHHADMPIVEQVYQVLFEGASPRDAVEALLSRDPVLL